MEILLFAELLSQGFHQLDVLMGDIGDFLVFLQPVQTPIYAFEFQVYQIFASVARNYFV